ncbi:hypothetical protein MVEN_00072200 [Mycena venus]|uniref:DUF6534 domain-containing protein n=1 Tax=Mycena venus TaxID=2733690 RepID=A0A8H7DH79_9AGAR|nr:hypothetical protein MVEN_00072200 [Mycena venus]
MSLPSLASTYGPWLISLLLETILYGIGIAQSILYVQRRPTTDSWSVKGPVVIVTFLETVQISFFFSSTYYRFVQRFGEPPGDLIWSDSLQLLADYLTAFAVQMYSAWRIHILTSKADRMRRIFLVGTYLVILLAFVQISAGIAQTILSYQLRSFSKLGQTKATTTLQTAASLACDVVIMLLPCMFLALNKDRMERDETKKKMNSVMMNAVIRGMLTAASSAVTMILFLVYPDTYWFFLSLAPNSQLYMNCMLATLNMRQHNRDMASPNGEDGMELSQLSTGRSVVNSPVVFAGSRDEEETLPGTTTESAYPSTDCTATATA